MRVGQARQMDPRRHQPVRPKAVRSLSGLFPHARRSRRQRCGKLNRAARRTDPASERSRACAGRSGRRGLYAAASPLLPTIRRSSPLGLLEPFRPSPPVSSRHVAREGSRALGRLTR
jgi:hypothetical protein